MCFKTYNPRVSQLTPREGWIPKHSSSTMDLSKNCAYHSNIQVHQGPLNNNCNPPTTNTTIVQGDPTDVYSKHMTRKRKSH
ncbi:hypothetical protein H5410_061194 [Solanum commersonii]|uniref:Uncharacterized protein n=1 Tax=Solanum commersonii TaxID=4109 RepID=A0A9J5W878_SOLCO|nr:hypothetical protein H5410_061194 [Solanum commersonii]